MTSEKLALALSIMVPCIVLFMALLDLFFIFRNRLHPRTVFAFFSLPICLLSFFIAGRFLPAEMYFSFVFSLFLISFISAICNTAFGMFVKNEVVRKYHLINSVILNAFAFAMFYLAFQHI